MESLTLHMMNTEFYIEVPSSSDSWKEHVTNWLSYVANEWSRFIPNNELDQINQLPIGKTLKINPLLYDCLKKAHEYYKKTEGLFSPYLKRQIESQGYVQSFPFKVGKQIKQNYEFENPIDKNPIDFLDNHEILKIANQPIDLGGFAKGYAVEHIKKWLQDQGFPYGIVDGGGDMTLWSNGEKEWTIGIADPFNGESIGRIKIQNGAIATSSRVYRSWIYQNEKKHHILNGQTGKVAKTNVLQATVVTDSLYQCEVSTKLCFLMDEQQLNQWFEQSRWRVARFIVNEDETTKWIKTGDGKNV
ncbi:FAD:protein FMN transferase [Rummeliibacillus sp. TYF005]|uniref:FAD:protein FMN transferase n=1 Tax=Rummeliibacillus sp. TYF005 TaxID=2058214 RepID=UPI000F53638C|nr:FAD:protein FMN transferase [Rummeliibacillus sp. TYF005]RPJ95875.1 FAD:protein FMN transferase [Rummeliibacillus sp. TYF005]